MTTLFEEMMEHVNEDLKVNFDKKEIKLNGKVVELHAPYITKADAYEISDDEYPFGIAEELYEKYKFSIPTKRERKAYFTALPEGELSDEHLVTGEEREQSERVLNLFILCAGLEGWLYIPEDNWYWQSKKDKDFVILKKMGCLI